MNPIKPLSISGLLFVAFMAATISTVFQIHIGLTFGSLLALSFVPMPSGVAMMAITKEVWQKDIVDNLYKDNAFAMRAYSADQYVLMGKVVHIPYAGTPSAVKKNLEVFPQTAIKRTDDDKTYAIDTLYSLPRHIEFIEKYELSYDKRQSVLGEDQAALIENAMDSLLFRWAPLVANSILTTGTVVPATITGAVGDRYGLDKAEFAKARLAMNKKNVPKAGRIALLTSDHYAQFFTSLSEPEKTDFGKVADLKEGIVGRYLGFDVMERSSVLRYRGADDAYVVVDELDVDFAPDDDDRAASLFYHDKSVERALGEVKIFDEQDKVEYYGGITSMLLRLGGRIRRIDGVWAVVEALA